MAICLHEDVWFQFVTKFFWSLNYYLSEEAFCLCSFLSFSQSFDFFFYAQFVVPVSTLHFIGFTCMLHRLLIILFFFIFHLILPVIHFFLIPSSFSPVFIILLASTCLYCQGFHMSVCCELTKNKSVLNLLNCVVKVWKR